MREHLRNPDLWKMLLVLAGLALIYWQGYGMREDVRRTMRGVDSVINQVREFTEKRMARRTPIYHPTDGKLIDEIITHREKIPDPDDPTKEIWESDQAWHDRHKASVEFARANPI